MADRDWSVWLEDRLSDPWTADRVATALNSDVLQQVGAKWASMTSPVKMRVMLAMIGARKGQDPKIANEFKKLLSLAANDEDEWVVVIGSMLRDLMVSERIVAPTNEGEPGAAIYTSSLEAVRNILSQTWIMDLEPLESLYLGWCIHGVMTRLGNLFAVTCVLSTDSPEDTVEEQRHFQPRKPLNRMEYGIKTRTNL